MGKTIKDLKEAPALAVLPKQVTTKAETPKVLTAEDLKRLKNMFEKARTFPQQKHNLICAFLGTVVGGAAAFLILYGLKFAAVMAAVCFVVTFLGSLAASMFIIKYIDRLRNAAYVPAGNVEMYFVGSGFYGPMLVIALWLFLA